MTRRRRAPLTRKGGPKRFGIEFRYTPERWAQLSETPWRLEIRKRTDNSWKLWRRFETQKERDTVLHSVQQQHPEMEYRSTVVHPQK